MQIKMMAAALACALALPAYAQDVSGAQQASQRFTAALSSGDAATAGSLLSDDVVALPPGRDRLSGKAAVETFLGRMSKNVQDLHYTSEEVKPVSDTVARETGSFSLRTRGQNGREISGKYLIVWVKSGPDWKVSADMWNRSAGAGGPGGNGNRRGRGMGGQRGREQQPQDEEMQ